MLPPETIPTVPPVEAKLVPVDVKALEHIEGNVYRLKFVTIADDGCPSVFDDEVQLDGVTMQEFIEDFQERRAAQNAAAIIKAKKREGKVKRSGTVDAAGAAALDGLFPSIGGK